MKISSARVLAGGLTVVAAGLVFASCDDDSVGPGRTIEGRFGVAPLFASSAAGIVEIAEIRFILRRTTDGSVARDTVISVAAGADSVSLELTVALLEPGESFQLFLKLITPDGDTAWSGGPVEVTPSDSPDFPVIEVPLVYVGVGSNAVSVRIETDSASLFTGEMVTLVAVALDVEGQPISRTPIDWTALDSARAVVSQVDSAYRAVVLAGSQRGDARLVATLLTGQADTGIVQVQPLPTSIAASSGDGQTGTVGGALAQPLVARVTAGDGQGVRGLWVTFAVTSGGGSVSIDSALTDSTGRAATGWTLGATVGPQSVQAATARLIGTSATFTATGVAGTPANIVIDQGDGQTGLVGTTLPVVPRVLVTDANGNPVPGISVTFEVALGSGNITGATPQTGVNGMAAIGGWTLGTTPGANALRAFLTNPPEPVTQAARVAKSDSTAALASPAAPATDTLTFTATANAGPAQDVSVAAGDAQSGTAGTPLTDSLVAVVTDPFGNPMVNERVAWSVTAGTGTLSSDTTMTGAAGLTAVTWQLGTTAGVAHQVQAELVGAAATATFSATALPDAPASLTFQQQPTDVPVDSVIVPAVVVRMLDQHGNVVTTDNVTDVDIAITSGSGTPGASLLGTTTRTAVAGIVTFDDLSIDAIGAGYTLEASIPSLTLVTSTPFNVTPPPGNVAWINPAGGNWRNGANWSTGMPPTVTDTVLITTPGTYTVTFDTSTTVARLVVGGASGLQTLALGGMTIGTDTTLAVNANGALTLTDATLNGPGLLTVAAGATLVQTRGTINADLANQGTIQVLGPSAWGGAITQSGTVTLLNDAFGNSGILTVATGFTNDGTIALATAVNSARVTVTAGTLVNGPAG
ncbi:MAG TPA: hypothetical protein VGA37_04190, partial [Gemmatimonadales bacterium]